MAHLSLSLLGQFQVSLDGKPVTTFDYNKVKALLAYLATEADRPHTRDGLVGLLWPDLPDPAARKNLSQALSNLRQAIGDRGTSRPFLLITHETIQFNPASDYDLDVATLSALLATCDAHPHRQIATCTACAERLSRATAFYRGDFLAHFFLPDSTPFEEWAASQRETLRQNALGGLVDLTAYHERRGDHAHAARYARRQLELDPWREAAHRQLMRLLALDGQRHAALIHYDTFRRALAKELDAPPELETMALYEQLRTAEQGTFAATGAKARLHNFPSGVDPFVGRGRELQELTNLIEQPACRLITLAGPGGIGKTRLAVKAAEDQVSTFADGVYFVPLGPLSQGESIVATIASALDIRFHATLDPRDQLLGYLREKELLLVLDSVEHLLGEGPTEGPVAGLVNDILQRAPRVSVLVTSRRRLHVAGEWLFGVPGLAIPPETGTDRLEDYDAVRLFVQCARRADHGFSLAPDDGRHLVHICRLLAGMPLGLEMAAAWVRVISCAEIAGEIQRSLDFLRTAVREIPDRHRSLRAVFDHSWRLLTESERRIFGKLSVFPGGFEREAAEQVAGASLPDLSALVDTFMLRRSAAGRYDIHELLRQYGQEKLAETGEVTTVRDLHLGYFLRLAELAETRLHSPDQLNWLARLEAEQANWQVALGWALDTDTTAALRLAASLHLFWIMRGYATDGRRWLERILAHSLAPPGPAASAALESPAVAARAKALVGVSELAITQGDNAVARLAVEEAVSLWRTVEQPAGLAHALAIRGMVCVLVGDAVAAEDSAQEGARLSRAIGDRPVLALALNALAQAVGRLRGDYAAASTYMEESGRLWREVGGMWGAALSLLSLGMMASDQGNYEMAQARILDAMHIYQDMADQHFTNVARSELAEIARRQGDVPRAMALFHETLAAWRALGNVGAVVRCLEHLAFLTAAQMGTEADRDDFLRQAVRLLGAAEALRQSSGLPGPPDHLPIYSESVMYLYSHLDDGALAAAWTEGQAMTLDQAVMSGRLLSGNQTGTAR